MLTGTVLVFTTSCGGGGGKVLTTAEIAAMGTACQQAVAKVAPLTEVGTWGQMLLVPSVASGGKSITGYFTPSGDSDTGFGEPKQFTCMYNADGSVLTEVHGPNNSGVFNVWPVK
jgi:hypothetical protein